MTQLITEVKLLIKELAAHESVKESHEWYLKNNLAIYLEELEKIKNTDELKIATRIFSRFCLESMDWDTPLFKRCTKITELGLKIAKNL